MSPGPSPRVCVVVSAFRSDAAVTGLLDAMASDPSRPFERCFVVDSLGSGAIAEHTRARGYDFVTVEDHPTNLGSAGNLARRLSLAAAQGFDFAFALNHDGRWDAALLGQLVEFAKACEPSTLGAVYPLHRFPKLGDRVEYSCRSPLPISKRGPMPTEAVWDVYWSSSNAALYALGPVRAGLVPFAELWMGWEDLAYGWLLHQHGFRQYVLTQAVFDDDYEFRQAAVGPVPVGVSDKPAWYAYYIGRNLLLSAQRTKLSLPVHAGIAIRILAEYGLTLAVRPNKLARLKLLSQGLLDGVRGKSGKGPVP